VSWPIVTLDDLKSAEPRAITDGPFGSNLARRHYTSAGPRVIRLQNIGDGNFVDQHAFISPEHYESLRAHEVRGGDLLVASLGEVLPRACLTPAWLGPAIVKADCIRVRLGEHVDPRWVLYALQRPEARRWADEHRHGVGRPRLGLHVIRRIPVPLPALDEQWRIVELLEDHLSHLDAAARGLRNARRRLNSLVRSTLETYFARGESVALGDLIDGISAGKSFGASNAPASLEDWGIIKVSAMTWGKFNPDENKAVPADRVDSRFEIHQGDLLISRANTADYVGASVLVGPTRPRLLLSDKSLRLEPKVGINPEWLWRALQTPSARAQIAVLATGTKDSMRNISQPALRRILLPKVDELVQQESLRNFAGVAASSDRLRVEIDTSEVRLKNLRASILSAAFTGRLGSPTPLDQQTLQTIGI
jgi:type I restriction enzyme, S subunit